MDCPNCGAVLNDGNQKFCEICGFELNIEVKEKVEIIKPRRRPRIFSRRDCC